MHHFTFGFSTMGEPKLTLRENWVLASQYGFNFIELRSLGGTLDLVRYFGKYPILREDSFIEVSSVNTSFCLCEATEAAVEGLMAIADLASVLKARYLRVFGSKDRAGAATPDDLERSAAAVHEVRARLARRRLGCELILETHDIYSRSDSCLCLNARLSEPLSILWDSHNTWKEGREELSLTWERLSPFIRHVHYKDSIEEEGQAKRYRYALPGCGDFPDSELIELLISGGYRGGISLEWERLWHPELPPLREALEAFMRKIISWKAQGYSAHSVNQRAGEVE